jgi:hypothetical protein
MRSAHDAVKEIMKGVRLALLSDQGLPHVLQNAYELLPLSHISMSMKELCRRVTFF